MDLTCLFRRWTSRRARHPKHRVTSHHVCCPVYGYDATITTRSRQRAGRPPHHVQVQTCSLIPKQPVPEVYRPIGIPELAYVEPSTVPGQSPHYTMDLPCRMNCLSVINDDIDRHRACRPRHVSGVSDCLDLELSATGKTVAETPTTRTPWSYAG